MGSWVCFAGIILLTGPIAIVLCFVLFRRVEELSDLARSLGRRIDELQAARKEGRPLGVEAEVPGETAAPEPTPRTTPTPAPEPAAAVLEVEMKEPQAVGVGAGETAGAVLEPEAAPVEAEPERVRQAKAGGGLLEERIGTRWVLIAGVIAVIFAAGFFLKYACENFDISDTAKVLIVAASGLVALAAGEITRRRGYDIVAKGVTAMGFGLLYVAVFAAYRVFDIIASPPAFAIAIAITACAMTYAVVLNEVIIAFLSLLGGYLTPLLLSTGENLPMPLFSYVLVLSVGAMLCAYRRRWRTVNVLAYLGTYALYAGWYERFFRDALHAGSGLPEQTPIALGWLGVFFVIYLVMPILNGLIGKVKAGKEDVLCVLGNAVIVFFYLWNTLYADARTGLAWCVVAMSAAHLAMMAVVYMRCRADADLRTVLLALGLSFLTVAMPLYWKFNVLAVAWAMEGVILLLIGLRYRSILTQAFGAIALLLGCANLLLRLPLHTGEFIFVRNADFGTWCFVAAAAYAGHLLYRRAAKSDEDAFGLAAQMLYALMGATLLAAMTMEWYWHCRHNLPGFSFGNVVKGHLVIVTVLAPLFVVRPICPRGVIREALAVCLVAAGVVCMFVVLGYLHNWPFRLFLNWDFAIVSGFVTAVVLYHAICRRASENAADARGVAGQLLFALAGALLFFALAAEWFFKCKFDSGITGEVVVSTPRFLQGVVRIFALILLLFVVRPICPKGMVRQAAALMVTAAGTLWTLVALGALHKGPFALLWNGGLASVLLFVAAVAVCHLIYRVRSETPDDADGVASQLFYALVAGLLFVALSAECYSHCQYNVAGVNHPVFAEPLFLRAETVLAGLLVLAFAARPLCPAGAICRTCAILTAAAGAVFTMSVFALMHNDAFLIFANADFAAAVWFVVALGIAAWLMKDWQAGGGSMGGWVALAAVFVLWVITSAEVWLFWYCRNTYGPGAENWRFLAHMYLSVTWALYGAAMMVAGFVFKERRLRYMALALFALLLAKVFIIDTQKVKQVYRIAAFFATGTTLVGVSYLYQFLKKKGFFNQLRPDAPTPADQNQNQH